MSVKYCFEIPSNCREKLQIFRAYRYGGRWYRSARTLIHKIANKVLVSIRVRIRVSY